MRWGPQDSPTSKMAKSKRNLQQYSSPTTCHFRIDKKKMKDVPPTENM